MVLELQISCKVNGLVSICKILNQKLSIILYYSNVYLNICTRQHAGRFCHGFSMCKIELLFLGCLYSEHLEINAPCFDREILPI
jgi:hypothetical protein